MELYKIKNLVMALSELGAANYAKIVFPGEDSISQREAYRAYGEARVKRWVRQNLIIPVRSGESIKSKKLYSRAELMAIDTAEKQLIPNNIIRRDLKQERINKYQYRFASGQIGKHRK